MRRAEFARTARRSLRNCGLAVMLLLDTGGLSASAKNAATEPYAFTDYPLPSAAECREKGMSHCVGPAGLVFEPDGTLWFAEQHGSSHDGGVARIDADGSGYVEFTRGMAQGSQAIALARGGDGNFWFTDWPGRRLGRMTPKGEIETFRTLVPGRSASAYGRNFEAETLALPYEIISDRAGNLWYTVQDIFGGLQPGFTSGYVARFSPSDPLGTLKTWQIEGVPAGLTQDRDGNIWIVQFHRWTDRKGGGLTRITPAGEQTTFPFPDREEERQGRASYSGCGLTTAEIAADAHGNLWFTRERCPYIGRFSPKDGSFSYFNEGLAPNAHLTQIRAAPDGNIYTLDDGSKPFVVWRIAPEGKITPIRGPRNAAGFLFLELGPDGNLWFSDRFADVIWKLTLPK